MRCYSVLSRLLQFAAVAGLATMAACSKVSTSPADAIYFGGPILTMEGDVPQYAEAIVVKDGRILFVGGKTQADELAGAVATKVDLSGRTLLPGFIDAHGHVWIAGFQKLSANLLPPPDGGGKDIASLVGLVKEWQGKNAPAIAKTGTIIGFGYDDSQLAEKRHPTAADLDKVSTEIPVIVIHQSSHFAAMNHKALALAGYTADSRDPAGGVIRREADGKTPNGVLEEMAAFVPLFKLLASLDTEANEKIGLAGVDFYAQFGFTTAQEGRASKATAETWRQLAAEGKLKIDVAAYPDIQGETEYMKQTGTSPTYNNHFRIAGVKLSLDGSPQGKTAWVTEPYLNPPPGQPDDYKGYPAIPKAEDREAFVDLAFERNWQILTHTNGDAASDALIDAISKAAAKYGKKDRRPVMIHAQMAREDQLDRMKELAIIPSFFGMHISYWGDFIRDDVMGEARAERWDPAASALRRGMLFTEHHDAPVALPSAMIIVHSAVNRTARSGAVIGPDQRISPYVALKSITDWAAYQYFEEGTKGTLTAGKLADFVILDKNPIAVAPETIKSIQVIETIKEGKSIYELR
jgi:predicted amidohydrolase YtcJ